MIIVYYILFRQIKTLRVKLIKVILTNRQRVYGPIRNRGGDSAALVHQKSLFATVNQQPTGIHKTDTCLIGTIIVDKNSAHSSSTLSYVSLPHMIIPKHIC